MWCYIDLAKPKSRARIFFFLQHVSRTQRLAQAKTRTWVIQPGAHCTDHWTTGQSCGIGEPTVHLTTLVKSSTLYGCMIVWSYTQIFSAWWVTTVISGRLPTRPITRTGRLLHTAKKKVNRLPAPVDNPHVVIQLFRWRKRDIKAT